MVLNTHLLLEFGCEWIEAVPPPLLYACHGVTFINLYEAKFLLK